MLGMRLPASFFQNTGARVLERDWASIGTPDHLGDLGDSWLERGQCSFDFPGITSSASEGGIRGELRVLIVESHELLARSLAFVLRSHNLRTEIACGPGVAPVLAIADDFEPTVALVDAMFGEQGSSRRLVQLLTDGGVRVLVLTGSSDRLQLAECLEAGAVGVFYDDTASFDDHLISAIQSTATGGRLVDPVEQRALLAQLERWRARTTIGSGFDQLTRREGAVLGGLVEGKSAQQIADESYVALGTVRCQIRAVLLKLGVHSQVAAVAAAHESGWTAA